MSDPLATVVGAWLDAYLALVAWGVVGLVLAVLTRSAAVAISIGVGYVLVVESNVRLALGDAADVLPGSTLNALASGGTEAFTYGQALTLGIAYSALGLALAAVVMVRRDVTD